MHRHASLNRIFRLVWSHVHQTWVVVSETSRGRGKRASKKLLLATAALTAAHLAQAGPAGGQVTAGAGVIDQAGKTTTVTQSSQNLSLLWKSFNTDASETVNFVQPSKSAIAVNRILDTNGTQFFGHLNANGQVYLINPNGVLFGAGSQINVGGLVASTLDVDDSALSGATRRFAGSGTGSVVNRGEINAAQGGYVAFVGNRVSNAGTVTAPSGAVALGAGSDVTLSFAGHQLVKMMVTQTTLDNLAENGGLIRADGGTVVLSAGAKDAVLASVVNNTGIIEAHSARAVNGTIVLDGGANSTVSNGGTLDASGKVAGSSGGTVKVLGDAVTLAAGGSIDVSGDTGGGLALVGGNFAGAGPERNASATTVDTGAVIRADALSSGAGGRVAVWSDGATRFDGRISAQGGAAGGDGGSVETSGKHLTVGGNARVTTLAAHGKAGDWLLDPDDFTIYSDGFSTGDMKDTDVTAALQSSNLTIKTGASTTCNAGLTCTGHSGNGDIILANGALIGGSNWTSGTTLTLSAYRNIELQGTANLDAGSGTGSMVLRSDNTGTGTGTVILGSQSNVYGNTTGTIKIYYNPSSYSSPTDYAALDDGNGNLLINMPDYSKLSTYMYVNLAPTVANKTYDGGTAATIASVSVRGGLPSDATVDTSGATAAFADKNVGNAKAVTVAGVTLSGSGASKYAINGLDNATANITKLDLNLSGVSAGNKTYDGTTSATMTGSAAVSALAGDVVGVAGSGAGSTFADKNAGTGKAVTVSGYSLTGADAGNYNLVAPTNLTADIAKANLNVTGVTANNRAYDGTAHATLSGTAAVSALGSDVVNVTGTGSATFADKNAGSGKAVTVTGYALSGADAANYDVVQPTGLTATIDKATLNIGGVSVADKVYDATTAATLAGTAAVAGIAGDDVSVTGSGSAVFVDKNVGVNKAVTVGGYTLGGLDAGNYTLAPSRGLTASISKADLALTGVNATNKTYDGTANATMGGSAGVTALGSDVVAVTGSGAGSTFADKNAGTGKAVTVSGYSLTGADAGNYNLVAPTNLTADIAKAGVSVTGVTANNRTYDGTTNATLGGTAAVAALGSDVVNVTGTASATFADKNAGSGKAVTVTGYTLGGTDAGNYDVVQPTGLTATINKADIAVAGLSATNKVYDGTSAAALSGAPTIAGFGGDDVSVTGSGSGSFADKNVGANKTVSVLGYTLGGVDAGNYRLVASTMMADITKLDLTVSGIAAASKTYDGTVAATLSGSAIVAGLGSDDVNVAGSGIGSTFADKNAGTNKAVTVSGYGLTGADAGNYNLVAPTGLTADIAKANLNVTGVTANNRTYDGTTNATLGGTAVVAALGGDVVNVTGTASATFADKNAGSGKAVTVTGYTLGGTDAGNYDVVQPTGLAATIGKADIAVSGLSAAGKTYDGTTAASVIGTASVAGYGSDLVAVTGSGTAAFADKNAGVNKAVTVGGYSLTGGDAGNYNLVQPAGLTATIARADLALTGLTANGKTYDGTTAATLSGSAGVTALGADVVTLSGSATGVFADKNAGSGKAVAVTGYSLTGADAGNYNLVAQSGLTASIAKASLTVGGIKVDDKTYDGTVAATLSGTATVSAFAGDAVVVVDKEGGAVFVDKNAGSDKAVRVRGFGLSGADAGNYTLVQPTGLTASIAKADVAVTGVSAVNKTYDGTTAATLSGTATVKALANDTLTVGGSATGVFVDKNAGAGKAVTAGGYTLGGLDAANYNLVQPTGLTASIAKASLAVSGVGVADKTYDGTTAATLKGTATVKAFGGDSVSVSGGSAAFADKNAGAGKAVGVAGYVLGGVDAANYNLVQPAGLTASITPAQLVVSGIVARDKTFDGTTAATVSAANAVLAGKIGSDAVTVASTGAFADAVAGAAKTVNLANAYGGADAGNYRIVDQATALASITVQAPSITPATAGQVRDAIAQVQSAIQPPQASARPQALGLSSTVVVLNGADGESDGKTRKPTIETSLGAGVRAPTLKIQNGGVQLPPLASTFAE